MEFRRSLLIVLFLLFFPVGIAAGGESCLTCHPPHYREIGSCTLCHRGDPRSTRPSIAHHELIRARFSYFPLPASPVVEKGGRTIDKAGCRRCHVIGEKGNRLASDLDRLLPKARPEEVLMAIQSPFLFMPDFALTEQQGVEIVNALFSSSFRSPRRGGQAPQVVHFGRGEREENAFEKHCGGCHRILTKGWGGIGGGEVAPNLSGLFTEHYPSLFRKEERWSRDRLKKWLENPRAIREQARMRPLNPGADLEKVLQILEDRPAQN